LAGRLVNKPAAMVLGSLNGRPDFSFQPSLDRNRILALTQLNFNERSEPIRLLSWSHPGVGSPGGPQRLAAASTLQAWPTSSAFWPRTHANASERIRLRWRPSLLIVDEVEYLSVIRSYRAAAGRIVGTNASQSNHNCVDLKALHTDIIRELFIT
jgi:hypothetical protein